VDALIVSGTERLRGIAVETLLETRKVMGIGRTFTRLRRRAERA